MRDELERRKMSRRHLALKAQIPSGRVSEILNGTRPLSPYYKGKITQALKLDPKHFVQTTKKRAKMHHPDRMLSQDELHFIRDWYHLAILSLVKTPDSNLDPAWFANRLAITTTQARSALKRLQKLKLIEEHQGRFVRTNTFLTTSKDIPSSVIRSMHLQLMDQSRSSLDKTPVEFRDVSHMMMAIDMSKLPQAKEEIRAFRKRMANILEDGNAEQVYLLGVQLVPLSKLK
ncbi:TIGR02147 family protein [Bdellovibrio bacteriovorus]|uniref:TIGR02147 family protein n=1 Tax=Bdellovibrio bacteriovorus TaxID=959 RepID=UPI001E33BCE3|nr:TIGR02147 family protein [Bdellovibrio bacteriovorus]